MTVSGYITFSYREEASVLQGAGELVRAAVVDIFMVNRIKFHFPYFQCTYNSLAQLHLPHFSLPHSQSRSRPIANSSTTSMGRASIAGLHHPCLCIDDHILFVDYGVAQTSLGEDG